LRVWSGPPLHPSMYAHVCETMRICIFVYACMRVCLVRAAFIAETFSGLNTFVPDQHWSVRVFSVIEQPAGGQRWRLQHNRSKSAGASVQLSELIQMQKRTMKSLPTVNSKVFRKSDLELPAHAMVSCWPFYVSCLKHLLADRSPCWCHAYATYSLCGFLKCSSISFFNVGPSYLPSHCDCCVPVCAIVSPNSVNRYFTRNLASRTSGVSVVSPLSATRCWAYSATDVIFASCCCFFCFEGLSQQH
jgi:hypothetical protein